MTFGTPAANTPAAAAGGGSAPAAPTARDIARGTGIPAERATAEPDAARRGWTWAQLMRRAFAIDVLACPHCGGRLRLIGTLHDPTVIRKILAHVGMAASRPSPGPAPPESGAAAP